MILRLFAAALLVYAFGFLGFAVSLPKPVSGEPTDAVVVLTGGPGRIARGLAVVLRRFLGARGGDLLSSRCSCLARSP